jgi:hypothetical protein
LHAASRGCGQAEGRASRLDSQRQPGVERDGKFARPRQQRHVSAILLEQRNAFAVLVRVEHGHSGGQRNFAQALAENFSLEAHRAAHSVVLNVQLHICMLDRVGKGRDIGLLRRLRREFHELVVFV